MTRKQNSTIDIRTEILTDIGVVHHPIVADRIMALGSAHHPNG